MNGEAWVIDAVRSPYGRRGGALGGWHPVDLMALVLNELLERSGADPGAVDDVVIGCGAQVGAQAGNIARRAVLAAGWPEHVPAATAERQAASSAQAVHWAAQAVMAGAQDLVVAGGVDVTSVVPLGANLAVPSVGKPLGLGLAARYPAGSGTGLLPPGPVAEAVARRWSLARDALDGWSLQSMARAARAKKAAPPLVAVPSVGGRGGLRVDEAVKAPMSAKTLRSLSPLFETDGLITAGNLAAEADGAAALLVASPSLAKRLKLVPKARLVSFAIAAVAPSLWPEASVPATAAALARAGAELGQVDRYDVHESSAAAVLAWLMATGADEDKVNPDGGALAHGAPAGAVGAGLFVASVGAVAAGRAGSALVCVAADGGVGTASLLGRI